MPMSSAVQLGPSQSEVYTWLSGRGYVPSAEVADGVGVTKSSAKAALRKLSAKGLVETRPSVDHPNRALYRVVSDEADDQVHTHLRPRLTCMEAVHECVALVGIETDRYTGMSSSYFHVLKWHLRAVAEEFGEPPEAATKDALREWIADQAGFDYATLEENGFRRKHWIQTLDALEDLNGGCDG